MNDAHIDNLEIDDVQRELRAELDVTPSPEFAAKVRARVAETAAARRVSRWAIWGGLAATAAVVIAVATTSTIAPPAVSVPAIVTRAAAPPVAPERAPDVPAAAVVAPVPTRKPSVRKAAQPAPARAALDMPRSTTPPVLEVVTNQPALIRLAFQLAAALQRDWPSSEPVVPGPIEPLSVAKVIIDPILLPPAPDLPPAGANPVIRRVSASDATRSPR